MKKRRWNAWVVCAYCFYDVQKCLFMMSLIKNIKLKKIVRTMKSKIW